jgi:hypothetical protein
MARVTGLGGVFFRARDRERLADWYRRELGIPVRAGRRFMLNYRVDDLEAMLTKHRR